MAIQGFDNNTPQPKPQPVANETVDLKNNSGSGNGAPVLDIVKKRFSWGAFFLNWIWGIGNNSFITLIIFPIAILGIIPFLGVIIQLACCIWFGIKGNEWAWQNKRWESIEHFHAVQKKWAIAGTVLFFVGIILSVIMIATALMMPSMLGSTQTKMNNTTAIKAAVGLEQAFQMNAAMGEKCEPTSEGLAGCFAKQVNVQDKTVSLVTTTDGVTYHFLGNGSCANKGDCSVSVSDSKGLLEFFDLTVEDGKVTVHTEEVLDKMNK